MGVVAAVLPRLPSFLLIRSSFACRRAASRRVTGSAHETVQTTTPARRADEISRFIGAVSYPEAKALVRVYCKSLAAIGAFEPIPIDLRLSFAYSCRRSSSGGQRARPARPLNGGLSAPANEAPTRNPRLPAVLHSAARL